MASSSSAWQHVWNSGKSMRAHGLHDQTIGRRCHHRAAYSNPLVAHFFCVMSSLRLNLDEGLIHHARVFEEKQVDIINIMEKGLVCHCQTIKPSTRLYYFSILEYLLQLYNDFTVYTPCVNEVLVRIFTTCFGNQKMQTFVLECQK